MMVTDRGKSASLGNVAKPAVDRERTWSGSLRRGKSREGVHSTETMERSVKTSTPTSLKVLSRMFKQLWEPPAGKGHFSESRRYSGGGGVGNKQDHRQYSTLPSRRRSDIKIGDVPRDSRPTPGVSGLPNHGNTCYMNAVLQCLAACDPLAEHFVAGHYRVDLARRNKDSSRKYGTRGELTEALARLLTSLWVPGASSPADISARFRALVSKFGPQFQGSHQHDAQEFLLWLLDKVHEDLNTASKKKYRKTKNRSGKSDEQAAAEELANHLRCNCSFVQGLFQAQLRSSLHCLHCSRSSNTFDPYLCLSVPVPQKNSAPVLVSLVRQNGTPRQFRVGLKLPPQSTFKDLRDKLCADYNVAKERLVFTDTMGQKTFCDPDQLSLVPEGVVAIETPASNQESLPLVCTTISPCDSVYGTPFVLQVRRDVSSQELKDQLLAELRSMTEYPEGTKQFSGDMPLKIQVVDGARTEPDLSLDVELPLYVGTVECALARWEGQPYYGPVHLKLALEWAPPSGARAKPELTKEDKSYEKLKPKVGQQPRIQTLIDCLQAYFREEKMIGEAWMCPHCHKRQQGVKQLALWSVPDILIIHLKRFRQANSNQRLKVTNPVEFPLTGLDLSSFLAKPRADHTMAYWKRRKMAGHYSPPVHAEDSLYDLFAVCNHQGDMQGGHYTAFTKNGVDGRWYSYDDTKVSAVGESRVVTPDAYILFYQRSSAANASCASSSTSGYSSSGSLLHPDHWVFGVVGAGGRLSRSQDTLSTIGINSPEDKGKCLNGSVPLDERGEARTEQDTLNDPCERLATTTTVDAPEKTFPIRPLSGSPSRSQSKAVTNGPCFERRYRLYSSYNPRRTPYNYDEASSEGDKINPPSLHQEQSTKEESNSKSSKRFWTVTSV